MNSCIAVVAFQQFWNSNHGHVALKKFQNYGKIVKFQDKLNSWSFATFIRSLLLMSYNKNNNAYLNHEARGNNPCKLSTYINGIFSCHIPVLNTLWRTGVHPTMYAFSRNEPTKRALDNQYSPKTPTSIFKIDAEF